MVDSVIDCRVEKQKERRRCQANFVFDLAIHLGKQMAQVLKLIELRKGFDSCPSTDGTALLLSAADFCLCLIPPLLLPVADALLLDLDLSPSSWEKALPWALPPAGLKLLGPDWWVLASWN